MITIQKHDFCKILVLEQNSSYGHSIAKKKRKYNSMVAKNLCTVVNVCHI